jgi:predicted RecB family endonuclease
MAVGKCLLPETVDKFKQALISGKINPERLSRLTSEERHKLFSDIVGEGNARFINSTFESKMLLKNQQQGYLTWAKKLTGVTPEVRRDLVSRISKLDKVLAPDEERAFLKDLASTKLGADVTAQEAKVIANKASRVTELEAKRRSNGTFPSESDRMAYGRAKVDFDSHMAELKNNAAKLSLKEQALHPGQNASKVAGLAKSLKASLDNSAIFRQGWKTLATNPRIWQKNARQSFIDIVKQLGGKETLKEVQADIVSRPNYDKYAKMKLAIGNTEEEFPTSLPEKVPLLGRVYKASEGAYTGFLYRQRADIADKMLQMAEKSGVDITDKTQLQSMGKLINSLTGRGNLGRFEGTAADSLNNLFFSARFLKSNIDTITAHQFQKDVTPFVRKQAAENLVKVIALSAGTMAIANWLKPGSAELDPRSKNFGKIKIGHTTFDVTGGMGALTTLAAQIIKQSSKSTTTGIVSHFNSGYGSQTGMDALNNFFENKLSPAASLVKDLVKQQDFNGNKPTVKGEASNLFTPLPFTNVIGNHDPQSANKLLISIADGLGIAANTNTPQRNSQQALKNSSTQQAFQKKVGDAKFQQASNDYNTQVNSWMKQHQNELNSLPESEQQSTLTTVKGKIQNKVYKQYGFTPPKSSKPSAAKKTLLQSVK